MLWRAAVHGERELAALAQSATAKNWGCAGGKLGSRMGNTTNQGRLLGAIASASETEWVGVGFLTRFLGVSIGALGYAPRLWTAE